MNESAGDIPKSDIEVLSQLVDDEEGLYRLRGGCRIYYLKIGGDVFDEDTMCRPYLLIPKLPALPNNDTWTQMTIYRDSENSKLRSSILSDPLVGAGRAVWHPHMVDILSLETLEHYRSDVHEAVYKNDVQRSRPMIAKFACFEWQIDFVVRETDACYELT